MLFPIGIRKYATAFCFAANEWIFLSQHSRICTA